MIPKSLLHSPARFVRLTRPYLEPLQGYDPARHEREAAIFVRWGLEVGILNSSRPLPRRMLWSGQIRACCGLLSLSGRFHPSEYARLRQDVLSTVWNVFLYTENGSTLAPGTITTRLARLFVSRVVGSADKATATALIPVLLEQFATLVMPMRPYLRPRPAWMPQL